MKFHQMLTHFRKRRGVSKTDLAKHLKLTPSYLMLIEAGMRKAPNITICENIAHLLHLSEEEKEEFILCAMQERSQDFKTYLQKKPSCQEAGPAALGEQTLPPVPQISFSQEILDALGDETAVKALLVTHRHEDLKEVIDQILEYLPKLSKEKRNAILTLCKH